MGMASLTSIRTLRGVTEEPISFTYVASQYMILKLNVCLSDLPHEKAILLAD